MCVCCVYGMLAMGMRVVIVIISEKMIKRILFEAFLLEYQLNVRTETTNRTVRFENKNITIDISLFVPQINHCI